MIKNDIDKIGAINLLKKSRRNKKAKAIRNSKSQITFSIPAAIDKVDPLSSRGNGRKRKANNRYGISRKLHTKELKPVEACKQLLGASAELAPTRFAFRRASNNEESTLLKGKVTTGTSVFR